MTVTKILAVHMSGNDDLYGSDSEEVILKKIDSQTDMITSSDLQAVIDGWEERFEKLTEGMRTIERSTHEVHAHMDIVLKDNCARENGQLAMNKQIKLIQEGLARFIETCDPAHPTPLHTLVQPCAPKMSTPITPSGAPTRYRSELSFASPVNQTTPVQPTRGDGGRNLNQQPTHEDGNRNGNDIQQPTMNENYTGSGLNNTTTRHSSSPKVPIFDGAVSAQFRSWLIQFEAIVRHQCWTSGEKVVRLVASLTGSAANLLIGMTMGQLDDYTFLVSRLSRRYDPPEQEEAHRAELRARTRRRNDSADEYAENLKNLAQRAYSNADQNMLDNLVASGSEKDITT